MGKLLNEIRGNLNKNVYLLIAGVCVYTVGILLGLFLPSGETASGLFFDYVNEYFCNILSLESSPVSFMFTRILNALLMFLLVVLLLSNRYTFFITLVIILYRGFIIGYTFIAFVLSLGFNGVMTYVFLVFLQSVITSFAILLLMINVYDKLYCDSQNYVKILVTWSIISFVICIISAIIEFLLIICLFRPLNFYF